MPAKLLQSRLTLCDPMDYNLAGSSVHGFLQARVLEWVAMPSTRGSSRPRDQSLSSGSPVSVAGLFPPLPPEVPLYRVALKLATLFALLVYSGTLSVRKLAMSLVRACVLCPGSSQVASVTVDQPPSVLPWPMRARSLEPPSYGQCSSLRVFLNCGEIHRM